MEAGLAILGHDLLFSVYCGCCNSKGIIMNKHDQEELLQKIDKIQNSECEDCDANVDYRDKYSKDLEEIYTELNDTISHLQKRRIY